MRGICTFGGSFARPTRERSPHDRRFIDLSLFLLTGIVLMGALPIAYDGPFLELRAVQQLGISLFFFLRRSPLFGPSLFMLLLSGTFLIPFPFSLWVFNLLITTALYVAALLFYPPIRENTRWLAAGRASTGAVLAAASVAAVSACALVLWAYRLRGEGGLWAAGGAGAQGGPPPGVGPFACSLPRFSSSLVLAAGIFGFSLANGALEEVMFRGVYTDGLSFLFRRPAPVVLVQALFFGLCHYRGIPSGAAGMGMSFLYGAVMGVLRLRTGGILAPIVAHVLTDAAIALVVLTP